ncbi:MAG: hypothetical protein IFNCLDLE_00772 [Ignavibacteriaceae bacterium]|nr:hypothetical protein [Ignavibacteriaceae bacterium]
MLLTVALGYYQRVTGPTYDQKLTFKIEGTEYTVKLPRSHNSTSDCPVIIPLNDTKVGAKLIWRRYKMDETYNEVAFINKEGHLVAYLPKQPPAGKLEYSVVLFDHSGKPSQITGNETVVIRFKGEVPAWLLIIHVIFMMGGMFFSNITGFYAIIKHPSFTKLAFITTAVLLIGGLVLGPIVQKYAFGVFWSGFPFGMDLTDNKLLVTFLFWFAAWVMSIKKPNFKLGLAAFVILILMYLIPHSAMGSEFDYKTNTLGTSKQIRD